MRVKLAVDPPLGLGAMLELLFPNRQ
jgi:hypothetical protein